MCSNCVAYNTEASDYGKMALVSAPRSVACWCRAFLMCCLLCPSLARAEIHARRAEKVCEGSRLSQRGW